MEGISKVNRMNEVSTSSPQQMLALSQRQEREQYGHRSSDDRRLVLLVIMLSFLFGLVLGAVSGSVFAAEEDVIKPNDDKVVNQASASEAGKKWQPPVVKQVIRTSPVDDEQAKWLKNEFGVEIISLRLTAAGYMMDFRFHVHDVEKSKIFFDQRVKPHLLAEKSNAKLPVPMATKVGSFRPTNRGKNIKPKKNYYMIFGNPDAHIKSGDMVTLVLGDIKVKNIAVD